MAQSKKPAKAEDDKHIFVQAGVPAVKTALLQAAAVIKKSLND